MVKQGTSFSLRCKSQISVLNTVSNNSFSLKIYILDSVIDLTAYLFFYNRVDHVKYKIIAV